MPNHSSVCEPSSEREELAQELYLRRGAQAASHRCDVNQQGGEHDLAEALLRASGLAPGETIVDVCCGTGQHLLRYRQRVAERGRAVGFDFSEAAVAAARARGVEAYVADAASLPLADSVADVVACSFGIYYLSDLNAALREWRRVLKSGGRLLICGPGRGTNAELYAFHEASTGLGPSDVDQMALGYVAERVVAALPALGFDVLSCETFINPVHFASAGAFLDYWESTSLFARSHGATRSAGERVLANAKGPLRITKHVSVLTARKATAT